MAATNILVHSGGRNTYERMRVGLNCAIVGIVEGVREDGMAGALRSV